MKDLQAIVRRIAELDAVGIPYILATIVQTSGSVYRGPGTRMLVEQNLHSIGTFSGGCLEGDVRENAAEVLSDGQPRMLHYDATSEDDILWGTGLGCSGTIDILLEKLPRDPDFHYPRLLYDCALNYRSGVLATVFAATGTTDAAPGQHLIFDSRGDASDDIGDSQLRHCVLDAARESLAALGDTSLPLVPGLIRHYELKRGRASVLIESLLPPISLHIFGAGYDAVPLAQLAGELGWRISVCDHRAPYVDAARFPAAHQVLLAQPGHLPAGLAFGARSVAVIMSHNYLQDQTLLARLLTAPVAYLGVLGPHARTQRLLADLARDGVAPSDEQRARLFGPVGLDIGAETPEGIALSILGEIQAVLTGRQGGKLRDHAGPIHDRPQ